MHCNCPLSSRYVWTLAIWTGVISNAKPFARASASFTLFIWSNCLSLQWMIQWNIKKVRKGTTNIWKKLDNIPELGCNFSCHLQEDGRCFRLKLHKEYRVYVVDSGWKHGFFPNRQGIFFLKIWSKVEKKSISHKKHVWTIWAGQNAKLLPGYDSIDRQFCSSLFEEVIAMITASAAPLPTSLKSTTVLRLRHWSLLTRRVYGQTANNWPAAFNATKNLQIEVEILSTTRTGSNWKF